MCLKEQKAGSCIFTGNLLSDSSFFAVTATNPGQCRPFSKDPLEVSLSSPKCSGGFLIRDGKVSRPPPVFGPGIRDEALEVDYEVPRDEPEPPIATK